MADLLRVLALLRPFWRRVLLALLLTLLTVLSGIGLMMTAAWLISTAALQLGITSLGLAPTAVRFFGLSRSLFRYLERLVSHDVTFRLLARLRVWFYQRLEPLSLQQRQAFRSGDLLTRLVVDIETLQDFYLRVVGPPLVALLTTLLLGLFFALIDGPTALFLVGAMLLTGTLLPWLAWRTGRSAGGAVVARQAAINNLLVDGVQGVADALAFGYQGRLRAELAEIGAQLRAAERRLGWLDGTRDGLTLLLVQGSAIGVLWIAADRVEGVLLAALTLGTVAAFEAITPLAQAGQNLGREAAAAQRIFAVIGGSPAIAPPEPAVAVPDRDLTLRLESVGFGYGPGEPPVLTDFSLTIPAGGRVLLTGPSGAGKSSLINLLLRFSEYQQGRILLGGWDLRTLDQEGLRRCFGVMTQRTHLFATTIRQNIAIGRPGADDAAIAAAAQAAGVDRFIQALPAGYDTFVGEGGALLSGGERQRIALARLLLRDAPIWLLDEISANLDARTAAQVLASVLSAGAGRTLILMTHRPQLVAGYAFDQVVRL